MMIKINKQRVNIILQIIFKLKNINCNINQISNRQRLQNMIHKMNNCYKIRI